MSLSAYLIIILLSFFSVVSTLVGVVLSFYCKKSSGKIAVGIGFSTGIMLAISFLELLPDSLELSGPLPTLIAVILGILFIFSLNFLFPHFHYFREKGKMSWQVKAAYLVGVGIILHDFPEGFAMANSYLLEPSLGVFVAISIFLHNIPEEFAMAVPLLVARDKKALVNFAIVSTLAEPLGALLGISAVLIVPSLNSLFLAFAAGAMIFISFHELCPMALRYKKLSYFALGIILSLISWYGLSLLF